MWSDLECSLIGVGLLVIGLFVLSPLVLALGLGLFLYGIVDWLLKKRKPKTEGKKAK